jgi:hypothetical protein
VSEPADRSNVGAVLPQSRSNAVAFACRKSNPDILLVQPAENLAATNAPVPLNSAWYRRILLQG